MEVRISENSTMKDSNCGRGRRVPRIFTRFSNNEDYIITNSSSKFRIPSANPRFYILFSLYAGSDSPRVCAACSPSPGCPSLVVRCPAAASRSISYSFAPAPKSTAAACHCKSSKQVYLLHILLSLRNPANQPIK